MIDQSLYHLNELMTLGIQYGGFKIEQREDWFYIGVGEFSYGFSGELSMEKLLAAHISIKSHIACKEKWYG